MTKAPALIYIPLLPATRIIVFGVHGSLRTLMFFYEDLGAPILILVLLVLLFFPRRAAARKADLAWMPEEIALFACLALNPILLHAFLMVRQGTFYNRYCLTTQVALLVALAILLPSRLRLDRRAGYAASAVLLLFLLRVQVYQQLHHSVPRNAAFLGSIHADLPIVVGEGQVFAEMNRYEDSAILSRLYYLKDREASLKFSNTNFFQDFEAPDDMQAAGFPYAAHIARYHDFVRQHHEFLLLSNTQRYVFAQLRSEGASFQYLGDYQGSLPYLDTTLYLVTLRQR